MEHLSRIKHEHVTPTRGRETSTFTQLASAAMIGKLHAETTHFFQDTHGFHVRSWNDVQMTTETLSRCRQTGESRSHKGSGYSLKAFS